MVNEPEFTLVAMHLCIWRHHGLVFLWNHSICKHYKRLHSGQPVPSSNKYTHISFDSVMHVYPFINSNTCQLLVQTRAKTFRRTFDIFIQSLRTKIDVKPSFPNTTGRNIGSVLAWELTERIYTIVFEIRYITKAIIIPKHTHRNTVCFILPMFWRMWRMRIAGSGRS